MGITLGEIIFDIGGACSGISSSRRSRPVGLWRLSAGLGPEPERRL